MRVEPKNGVHAASDDRHNHAVWKRLVPRMSFDLVLESILVSIVTGYFIYLLLAVRDLRPEAARLPTVTAIGGLVLVAAFIAQKIWDATHPKQNTDVQILDTGFDEEGLSGRLVLIRTLRLASWFGGMLAAIWVCWLSRDSSCVCIFLPVGLWRDQMVAGCDGRSSIFFTDLRFVRSRSPHRMARTCAAALAIIGHAAAGECLIRLVNNEGLHDVLRDWRPSHRQHA